MKKSRFTEHQIISILKEADAGIKVQEIWGLPELPWKEKCCNNSVKSTSI